MDPANRNKIELSNPWIVSEQPIVMAASFSLFRNIEKFKFPNKLSQERRLQLVELLTKKIVSLNEMKKASILRAESLTPGQKEYISEHFLLRDTFQEAQIGEAFVIDQSGEILVTINVEDHLHIHFLGNGKEREFSEKMTQIYALEKRLQELFPFSYSAQFGYLTASPCYAGTGLTVSSFLHIPLLLQTKSFSSLWEKRSEELLHVENFLGHATPIGDIAVIANQYCLGVNEEAIVHAVFLASDLLEKEEKILRDEVKAKEDPQWKDKISRAFALSTLSYQIESLEELLGEISFLKLGVDLGWIEGISLTKLNQIFLSCRRAHLAEKLGERVLHEQLPHLRADFIHQELKEAKLLI